MKKMLLRLTVPAVALVLAVLGCSNPSNGGGEGFTSPVTITGNSAYYYDPDYDYYKGVFIEGRTVTLSPFWIAQYETTYDLWYMVYQWATDSTGRGANVYTFANPGCEGYDGSDGAAPTTAKNEPVTCITWRDAIVWCNAYSEKSGKEPVYYTDSGYDTVLRISKNDSGTDTDADKAVMKPGANGYRLPTEAEWEYAARGGGTPSTTGAFADKWSGTNDEDELEDYAWYYDNSYSLGSSDPDYGTHAVGTRAANGMGLYDMSGNVWEWCWDWYDSVSAGTETDPAGPVSGTDRVIRGGDWNSFASDCAVARRNFASPDVRVGSLGFRLAACP